MSKLMKVILILLLLLPVSSQANWRNRTFWNPIISMIYVIHPQGNNWYYTCTENAAGKMHCNWKG